MIPFAVTARRNGKVTRRWERQLPVGWSELPSDQERLRLLRLLLSGEESSGRLQCLRALLRLPDGIFFGLSPVELSEILDKLDWLKLEPSPVPIVSSFLVDGRRYHLASEKFANGTALEYPIADEYFSRYVGGEAEALPLLCATLARPARPAIEAARVGDRRIPLHGRAEVEERAQVLRKLPFEAQMSIALYFAGVKKYVSDLYAGHLFPRRVEPEEGEEAPPIEEDTTTSGDMFGWWGVYMSVAEQGVFGALEAVHQTNFHTICMYLVKKKQENEEMKRQMRQRAPSLPADFE